MPRKDRDIDKDTVVAYHDFIQGKIKGELNGVDLGPGRPCCVVAGIVFVFGLACGIVGILLITLRTRHVYLWDWNDQFLGPFFVIMLLLCTGIAVFLIVEGNRRANAYRRDLVFRPIGDYGVAVTHKSRLNFEEKTRETLKSGTTPHKPIQPKPYQPISYDHEGRPRKPRSGFDNRGYKDDPRGPPPKYEEKDRRPPPDYTDGRPRGPPRPRGPDDRRPPDDRDRRRGPPPGDRDRRRPPDDRRRPPDDRRRPPDDRRRPPDDRRRPPDDRRRPPDDRDRRRGPPDDRDRRGPPPDDRYRDPEKRRMEDERRREDRRRYEEERRRRAEEQGDTNVEKPPVGPGFRLPADENVRIQVTRPDGHESESEL